MAKTVLPAPTYVAAGLRQERPRREYGNIDRLMRAPSGRVFQVDCRNLTALESLGWRFIGDDA